MLSQPLDAGMAARGCGLSWILGCLGPVGRERHIQPGSLLAWSPRAPGGAIRGRPSRAAPRALLVLRGRGWLARSNAVHNYTDGVVIPGLLADVAEITIPPDPD